MHLQNYFSRLSFFLWRSADRALNPNFMLVLFFFPEVLKSSTPFVQIQITLLLIVSLVHTFWNLLSSLLLFVLTQPKNPRIDRLPKHNLLEFSRDHDASFALPNKWWLANWKWYHYVVRKLKKKKISNKGLHKQSFVDLRDWKTET